MISKLKAYCEKNILMVWARADQYVGIYRTGTISLKYGDAISKQHHHKPNNQDIKILQ